MARVLGFLRRLECAEGVINFELGVLLKKEQFPAYLKDGR
jgi:hypothetical protein